MADNTMTEDEDARRREKRKGAEKKRSDRRSRRSREKHKRTPRGTEEKLQRAQEELEAKRRTLAQRLSQTPPPSATARVALRLPSGQRLDRKFEPSATLQEDWAHCVAFLPEHADKGLEIPERFVLKTSFPVQELNEMTRTVDELKLSGTNILLAAIEDD
eukprot:g19706.t1